MSTPLARVGDLAEQIRGVTYAKEDACVEPRDGYVPILRAGNISDEGLTLTDLVFVPSARVSERQLLRRNDVLVAASSGSLDVVGKAALVDSDLQAGFGAFCKVLRPSQQVHPAYFAHFFKTPAYRSRVSALAAGANINNLRNEDLNDLALPLPSPDEQRRIAGILDCAETLRAKRRAALAQIDGLTQAIFLEMFGDPVTNPKEWKLVQVADLAEELRYGTSEKSTADGAPVLRIPNVVAGVVDYEDLKYVDVDSSEFSRLRLVDGDLLFVRTNGNPDYVGRCAVFDQSAAIQTGLPGDRFVYASYLIRARLSLDAVSPIYLREFMLSPAGRKELRARAKTSAGQFNVNAESLRAIPVPLPPVSAQRFFASRAAAVDKLKASHRASLAQLDALFASLQHRAFRGEL